MTKPLIMTPGPTEIHEDVRKAMAQDITNPDLDINFYEYYRESCNKLNIAFQIDQSCLLLDHPGPHSRPVSAFK